MMTKSWYVLYTFPRHEKKVFERLLKNGFAPFLPLQHTWRQWSDRKRKVEVPVFPNYVFVNATVSELYNLVNIPGIIRYITDERKPATISNHEIELIRSVLISKCEVSVKDFSVGDNVEIVNGSFAGMQGLLNWKSGNKIVSVLIESIGKVLLIRINRANIDFVSNLPRCLDNGV